MGQMMFSGRRRDPARKKPPLLPLSLVDDEHNEVSVSFLTRFFQLCISIARRFTFVAGNPPPESNHPPPINFNNNNNQHYSVVDVVDQIDDPILETTPIGGDIDDGIGIERSVVAEEEQSPVAPPSYKSALIGGGVEDEIGIERSVVVEKEPQPQPPLLPPQPQPPLLPPQQTQSSKSGSKNNKKESLGPYNREMKILLVGEGDFSFSTSLATAFGDAPNIVATSLNSIKFLRKNYANAVTNITELTSRGCTVIHGVDATKMVRHPQLRSMKFDCIVYNFPHAGFDTRKKASREEDISKHQALVTGFLENAKKMIKKDDGQIHITHKCVGFFLAWDLKTLGSSQGLRLVEETPFKLKHYPGYATKYGYGGDGDFDWNPSKTYKFQLSN